MFLRHIAIKTLNFACQENFSNSNYLVEIDGLGSIFSYFMGKGMKNKLKKMADLIEENEEHCVSIITTLCKFLVNVNLDRLVFKFQENNFEKCERLIEFYKKYEKKLKDFELISDEEDSDNNEDLSKNNRYFKKLNKGLLVFQNVSFILAFILSKIDKKMTNKIKELLKINDIKMINIKNTLLELISYLDNEDIKSIYRDSINYLS